MTTTIAAEPVAERVDELFSAWNRDDTPGCALGVVRDGELVHEAYYGMANLEAGLRHSASSVFDIASTTKQFTATAMVLLEQAGELSLDDDVRAYVPEVPDYGTPITIRHLIHHTGGLRDYINLRLLAGTHEGDHVDMQDVIDILSRQRGLNFAPGTDHMYSNSGYVLMAVIAGRVTGEFFGDWCRGHIFEPLGMASTRFRSDVSLIVPGLVQMYAPRDDGGLQKTVDNEDVVGDGGLLSTVPDLARWERNFIEQRVGGPGFTERMSTPGTAADVEERYAFGLVAGAHRGLRTVSHGGNLHGFSGEFLRFPEQRLAVICLANLGAFDASGKALAVADIFLEQELGSELFISAPPIRESAEADIAEPIDVELIVGPYREERSGSVIDVVREGSELLAAMAGERMKMTPGGGPRFTAVYRDFPIDVLFEAGDGSSTVRFSYNGQTVLSGTRIAALDAGTIDLDAYAGRYHSDELGVDATVSAADGQLFLQRGGAMREPLRPSLPDEFAMRFAGVRFTRGDAAAVDGFELSMARSAAVAFRRAPRA